VLLYCITRIPLPTYRIRLSLKMTNAQVNHVLPILRVENHRHVSRVGLFAHCHITHFLLLLARPDRYDTHKHTHAHHRYKTRIGAPLRLYLIIYHINCTLIYLYITTVDATAAAGNGKTNPIFFYRLKRKLTRSKFVAKLVYYDAV